MDKVVKRSRYLIGGSEIAEKRDIRHKKQQRKQAPVVWIEALIGDTSGNQRHQSFQPEQDIGASKVDRARGSVHCLQPTTRDPGEWQPSFWPQANPPAWGKQNSCFAWVKARCWAGPSKTYAAPQ